MITSSFLYYCKIIFPVGGSNSLFANHLTIREAMPFPVFRPELRLGSTRSFSLRSRELIYDAIVLTRLPRFIKVVYFFPFNLDRNSISDIIQNQCTCLLFQISSPFCCNQSKKPSLSSVSPGSQQVNSTSKRF
jgi:hypothetical protein